MATKKKTAKKGVKARKRGGGKLDIGSDPPIIVGGGGSTWIWIKRSTNVQLFDPTNLPPPPFTPPDPAITPVHPEQYNLLYLGNFSVANVHFNNGNGVSNNHSVPNNPNGKSKNNTFFD